MPGSAATARFGVFGLGYRANATIGRALRLMMINFGGVRPGSRCPPSSTPAATRTVSPEHARTVAEGRLLRDDLKRHIQETVRRPYRELLPNADHGAGANLRYARAKRESWMALGTERVAPRDAPGRTNRLTFLKLHAILSAGSGTHGVR